MTDLILHESIVTTEAKAKAVKPQFERLVTKAKLGTVHARRLIHQILPKSHLVNKLVDEIAIRSKTRPGGYTRIIKGRSRRGDNTRLVTWQLVDRVKPSSVSVQPAIKPARNSSAPKKSVPTKPISKTTKQKTS